MIIFHFIFIIVLLSVNILGSPFVFEHVKIAYIVSLAVTKTYLNIKGIIFLLALSILSNIIESSAVINELGSFVNLEQSII